MDVSSRGKTTPPPKILEYRKHLKIVAFFSKYSFIFFLCVFLFYLTSYFFFGHESKEKQKFMELALSFGVLSVILYLEYFFILRPLAIKKFQVYQDKIIINFGKKETIIPFDDILKIERAISENAGGWFKLILKNKNIFRFTIVLEQVAYILDAIIKHNPKFLKENEYLELKKILIIHDHGFGRLYDFFKKKNLFSKHCSISLFCH